MRYGAILRRAWDITWCNKTLWWLGLFSGGASSANFNFGGNSVSFDTGGSEPSFPAPPANWMTLVYEIQRLLPVIAVLFIVGVLILILSVAARGGLIAEVDVAAQGAKVSATRGWGRGFTLWWRLAVILVLLALPILLFELAIFAAVLFELLIPLLVGEVPRIGPMIATVGALAGAAFVMMPVSIFLSVLGHLSLRFAVLSGSTWLQAISLGWFSIKTRFKDVVLMWLVLLIAEVVIGLAFVFAFGLALVLFGVPIVLFGVAGLWPLSAAVLLAMVVLLAFFVVLNNTFQSAVWTVFWRQMTGREPVGPPLAGELN